MKIIPCVLLILPLLLSGGGCVMSPKLPALHDFGPAISDSAASNEIEAQINVDAPTWLWDIRIRYRLLYASPTQVGFYALDQWVASPPELFQQQLVAGGNKPSYRLLIRLLEFEQQFNAPDQAKVIMRFSIEAFSSGYKRKLGAREFSLQQPTKTANAAGAVSGFSRLIQEADAQIRNWLVSLPED